MDAAQHGIGRQSLSGQGSKKLYLATVDGNDFTVYEALDRESLCIVAASSEEEALEKLEKYAYEMLAQQEDDLLEYVYIDFSEVALRIDRSLDSTVLDLQGMPDEELLPEEEKKKAKFNKAIREFFSEAPEYADLYLDYYWNCEWTQRWKVRTEKWPFPKDMLMYILTHTTPCGDLLVIPIDEVKLL